MGTLEFSGMGFWFDLFWGLMLLYSIYHFIQEKGWGRYFVIVFLASSSYLIYLGGDERFLGFIMWVFYFPLIAAVLLLEEKFYSYQASRTAKPVPTLGQLLFYDLVLYWPLGAIIGYADWYYQKV